MLHACTESVYCLVVLPACTAVLAGIRGKIEMFNFSAATLERAGLPSSAATHIPPFVVIASNDINQVCGRDVHVYMKPSPCCKCRALYRLSIMCLEASCSRRALAREL